MNERQRKKRRMRELENLVKWMEKNKTDLEIVITHRSNKLFPAPADPKPFAELVAVLSTHNDDPKNFLSENVTLKHSGIALKLQTSNLQHQIGETRGLAVLDSFTAEFDKKIQRLSKKLEECI